MNKSGKTNQNKFGFIGLKLDREDNSAGGVVTGSVFVEIN